MAATFMALIGLSLALGWIIAAWVFEAFLVVALVALQGKLERVLIWLALAGWVTGTLAGFSALETTVSYAKKILTTALELGHLSISLGDVIGFLLAVWLSLVVSRFVRFLLDQEVYGSLAVAAPGEDVCGDA